MACGFGCSVLGWVLISGLDWGAIAAIVAKLGQAIASSQPALKPAIDRVSTFENAWFEKACLDNTLKVMAEGRA